MNIQRVKQGAKITLYSGYYSIVLGFYFIFIFYYNMKLNFKAIDELWGFFSKYNPDIAYIFILFNILIGIQLIAAGIMIIYLSDFIIKRKDKMTWVMLFIIGLIEWAGLLTVSVLLKNWVLVGASLLGWIIFIIGMMLPLRYYLEKNYREY
ncbi:MAG: hypothetical protein WC867_06325 [Candidatus Pacearchaeota archaeon]|jgi:hypothetical protein